MLIGALLVAFGVVALIANSGVFSYTSHKDLPHGSGEAHIRVKQEKMISISPLLSGVALAAGVTLMLVAARK
jgi:hypothetical protein